MRADLDRKVGLRLPTAVERLKSAVSTHDLDRLYPGRVTGDSEISAVSNRVLGEIMEDYEIAKSS
jgi:hypothetical protein